MLVAVERFDLRIPGCGSLKAKRHVVKALTGGLRAKFPIAVAEVDHQDLWQRSAIGVAVVGGEGHHLKRVLHEVERFVEVHPGVELIDREVSMHDPEDA
ncbi:MAG: DUF503 domain-containing protein [Actinomycetota bacterium]